MSGTGSLMIRNLRKASDYDKARMNQDELLKIAIANDNNISNARRAYRQGEVPALTPQQSQTPDEIQADVSKNYSDAITNLLSLGMDYREASDIATRLGADPTNLQILNNTFPSLKVDFQKRFDVKRITATGFVDFFRKFREVFDETKGIADNSTLFNDKFDRIINNIADLRAVLPTKTQISSLKQSLKDTMRGARGIDPREIAFIQRQLDQINRKIPDERFFQQLAQLNPQEQFERLAQIQDRLVNMASRDDIQRVIDLSAGQASPNEILEAIKNISDVGIPGVLAEASEVPEAKGERLSPSQLENLPPMAIPISILYANRLYDGVKLGRLTGGRTGIVLTSSAGTSSTLSQGIVTELLKTDGGMQRLYSDLTGKAYTANNDNQRKNAVRDLINGLVIALQPGGAEAKISRREENPEEGHGILFQKVCQKGTPTAVCRLVDGGRNPQSIPLRRIGKGISIPEEPTHIEFGKHLLHYKNLEKSVLSLHHKKGGRVASIPVQKISEDLKDFIVDTIQQKKASSKEFSRLPIHEQKLFERIATGAGIFHKLGLKPVMDDDDKKNMERFEVLRGEFMAGNNSHELVRELRKLVIYFMDAGRLTKSQGRELLLNIN